MSNTLIGAIGELSRLQRWNTRPRVEIWTEAENIAFTTHIVYAIGKKCDLDHQILCDLLVRSLLKSFNKHYLSDIPVETRDQIRSINPTAWQTLINGSAKEISKLFNKEIRNYVYDYMTFDGDYSIEQNEKFNKIKLEELIKFSQYRTALFECAANKTVYPEIYNKVIEEIDNKINNEIRINDLTNLKKYYSEIHDYLKCIHNLKYLRRWNRINRTVETSVLGHTFIVAFLTLIIFKLCEGNVTPIATSRTELLYSAILKALFHDVPESFTVDIITPVKDIIKDIDPYLLKNVEQSMTDNNLVSCMPEQIKSDNTKYAFLIDLNDIEPFTVDSLVKSCDRLAIIMECLFEIEFGKPGREMNKAFFNYLSTLEISEWQPVRELCSRVRHDNLKITS